MTKQCIICFKTFTKDPRVRMPQWLKQKYCSNNCRCKGFTFQNGIKNPNWKGGKYKDIDGYIYIRAPKDHPYKTYNGYIYQHRYVMENHLKRVLEPHEKVHHLNGIKSDNRIKNLVVITQSEHIAIHRKQMNEKRSSS